MNTIETLDATPFRHLVMTIGELPSSFVDSMSYYELLAWLCNYVENNVVSAINNNVAAVEEIQEWIETLDLQDEVNNKLDEMKESGELADIIAGYLNLRGILAYDTVAAMKAADNLVDGSFAETYGFYAKGDGGGAKYKIRTITNADVVDNIHLFAIASDNTLVAELINGSIINVKQYGAIGDGETDDTSIIQAAVDDLPEDLTDGSIRELYFPSGTYLVTDTIDFTNKKHCKIHGNAMLSAEMAKPIIKLDNNQWLTFEDLYVRNTSTATGSQNIYINASYIIQFSRMYLRDGDIGIYINSGNDLVFNEMTIRNARINVYTHSEANNTSNVFNNCTIEGGTAYNVYFDFDRPYYGIYTFNRCYFETPAINCYLKNNMQVYFNNCYLYAEENGAIFFEVDHVSDNETIMRLYCNGCRFYDSENDEVTVYLVKSLKSTIVGCLTLDETCFIRSHINPLYTANSITPTILAKTPEQLDVYNSSSVILNDDNTLLGWTLSGAAPTITTGDPFLDGAENSITFGGNSTYFIKKIFLKANVTYKFTIASKAGTGSARFDIFDGTLSSRKYRYDNSAATNTVSDRYYTPTESGVYALIIRNTGSDVNSSFSGLKIYSLEPKPYNLF